jgi:hypothetical protein
VGINLEGTAALLMLFAASLATFSGPIMAYAQALLLMVSCSSVAVLLSFALGPDSIKPTALILSFLLSTLSIVFSSSRALVFRARNLAFLGLFGLLASTSQLIVRQLGLSSVAFTDGHTILQMANAFQVGVSEPLGGIKALKRGFGLPAMQSLGFTEEYFVGLMPLFFLAAILATGWVAWVITGSTKTATVVTAILVPVLLTTEAIARHIFLMNTHSIAWLITAVLLGYAAKAAKEGLSSTDSIGVLTAFTAVGFLRFDYLLLFAGFTFFFMLVNARSRPVFALSTVFVQVIATMGWTSKFVIDFPFFGPYGAFIVPVVALIGGGVLVWIIRRYGNDLMTQKAYPLFVPAGIVAVLVIALTNTSASLESLGINLFFGEGLWGFTFAFVILVTGASCFRLRVLDKALARQLAGIGALTVLLYLFSKYGDGPSTVSANGFARVGFGDSLNRTLVTWVPFLVLPLIRLLGLRTSKGNIKASKEGIKNE